MMRRFRSIFLGIALSGCCFSPFALAQTTVDGVVEPTNYTQYRLLQEFAAAGTALDQLQSAKMALAVTEDKSITTTEVDLISELIRTDVNIVATKSADGGSLDVPVATTEGAVILSYIISKKKFDVVQKWQSGPDGLAFLGLHYHLYPATKNYISNAIVPDLMAADKASNTANAYGPLRTFLQGFKTDIAKLPKFEQAYASQMMYDIVSRVSARKPEGLKIPGFIYDDFDNRRHKAYMP